MLTLKELCDILASKYTDMKILLNLSIVLYSIYHIIGKPSLGMNNEGIDTFHYYCSFRFVVRQNMVIVRIQWIWKSYIYVDTLLHTQTHDTSAKSNHLLSVIRFQLELMVGPNILKKKSHWPLPTPLPRKKKSKDNHPAYRQTIQTKTRSLSSSFSERERENFYVNIIFDSTYHRNDRGYARFKRWVHCGSGLYCQ